MNGIEGAFFQQDNASCHGSERSEKIAVNSILI